MSSVSSTDSQKRQRSLDSLVFRGGSSRGNTLSINYLDLASPMASVGGRADRDDRDIRGSRANRDDQDSRFRPSRRTSSSPSTSRKRSRSKSESSSVLSEPTSKCVRKETTSDGQSANVCMVKRSTVRELRGWMKNGIDSKAENLTLRSSYKPSFEGNFELMAPELGPSMVRKWLRNIGDTSDKPKIKDFWEKNLRSIQRELKDVFEPLIHLLCSVLEGHDAELCIRTATRLLGHVFSHITKMRRSNVIRHVAPKFSNMLVVPLLFSTRDHRYLFGEKFISAMNKEADIDAKMDKIGRLGGYHSSRRGNAFSRKGDYHSGGGTSNYPKPNWNCGKPQQQ